MSRAIGSFGLRPAWISSFVLANPLVKRGVCRAREPGTAFFRATQVRGALPIPGGTAAAGGAGAGAVPPGAHGGGGVGVPDGQRERDAKGGYRGGGEEGVVERGDQRGAGRPGGLVAETTVTSTATPKPPAIWVWVWNSAAPRPVSAEEMVANDEVWAAMTHQPLANPLLKVSSRISQMLVSSPIVSPITVQTAITPHRPPTAIRRGPTRG